MKENIEFNPREIVRYMENLSIEDLKKFTQSFKKETELSKKRIESQQIPKSKNIEDLINYCIWLYLKRKNIFNVKELEAIHNLIYVNPAILFSFVLKEIAIKIDSKYTDPITKSETIYAISSCTGKICQILDINKDIKSFKGFAAFRTYEDAVEARHICTPLLKLLFK
jgi:hypothetical protein